MRREPGESEDNFKKRRYEHDELLDMPEDEFLTPEEMKQHLARYGAKDDGDDQLAHAYDYLQEGENDNDIVTERIRRLREQIKINISLFSRLIGIIHGFTSEQIASGRWDEAKRQEISRFVNYRAETVEQESKNSAGFDLKQLARAAKKIQQQVRELEELMEDEGIPDDTIGEEED